MKNLKPMAKVATIAFMSLLMLIPLALIQGQVAQREHLQSSVQDEIADSAAGQQLITGPVVLMRYQEERDITISDEKTGKKERRTQTIEHSQYFVPETFALQGHADTEIRQRSIYKARLFHLMADVAADFQVQAPTPSEGSRMKNLQASLVMGLSDLRGIADNPSASINGKKHSFNSLDGDKTKLSGHTIGIDLGPIQAGEKATWQVRFPLKLTGSNRLGIAPVGQSNRIALRSDWADPKFSGRFLPRERQVSDAGFQALWEVSHLARDRNAALFNDWNEVMSVDFIEPVNIYLKAERASKYGILFIVLTFAAFFLTEVLRQLRIHPLQYLLVGLALAIFFLLLIAFSEHMPFALAYGLAATACIGIITLYLASVLKKWPHGLAFGAALCSLYGLLYGILNAEDSALLMGSLLLFVALAAVMLSTRKVNWYGLHKDDNTEAL